MRLSIIELATVAPGTTEKQALIDSVETARHADQAGFHRVWFAEHHLTRSVASHHPELLMTLAASQTTGIRIGSGAVLINHSSPLEVAETFKQLEAMFPGRIDLGLGRATAGPVIDLALQRDHQNPAQVDHQQQVLETLAWLYDRFPVDHPFAEHRLAPSVPEIPQTWLLGSSAGGSGLAAALGIGYTFAGFINPAAATVALRNYRQRFQPQDFGLDTPRAILAVNVTVADTAAEAGRLVGSAAAFFTRLRRDSINATVPSADEAARLLTPAERDQPTVITDGRWPQFVAGTPSQVRATLEQMLAETGADELMIHNLIADPDDRRYSHQLLAEQFALTPRVSTDRKPRESSAGV